ncbi:MAG: 2-dehydro-3-deoxygalactonokinase [Burkholderiales bacterium]|nr:2-dehydro-3-deoxygalactonokinase [Burkholderiales bacterium]
MTSAALYALDWGTTSARAYRMDTRGAVLEARSAPLGIAQVDDGRFHDALLRLLGDWQHERAPRLACGMIGSRQGWVETPYVACPARLPDLAAGIVRAPEGDLCVVPGVRTRDANGIPDVMRGEETQIAGGVDEREERVLAVLPGTHSKWALVESGRIVDFATFMTGEIWGVLLAHSILGRLAVKADPEAGPGPGFARGVARGLGAGNLAHDMFGARSLALLGELPGEEVADWLSGVMIGREVRNSRTWAQRHGYDGARVRLIGDDRLVARYAQALAHADVAVERADSRAAAYGLWRIAVEVGIVDELR